MGQGSNVLLREVGSGHVGQKGQDGGTGVATDHRYVGLGHIKFLVLGNKGVGTDDVQGGDAEEPLLVVDPLGLQGLGEDRHGGVHRVGDDQEHGLRAGLGAGICQALYDAGVDVEEIVTGHAGLSGDTSGDHDNVSTLKSTCDKNPENIVSIRIASYEWRKACYYQCITSTDRSLPPCLCGLTPGQRCSSG